MRKAMKSLHDHCKSERRTAMNSFRCELIRLANGHLSCELPGAEPSDIGEVKGILEEKFGKEMWNESVCVMCDEWSDVFIMQFLKSSHSADRLIKRIYEYLCEISKA